MKVKTLVYILGALAAALLLFLLKENEGRLAAEARLRDLQINAEAVRNQKENAINELEVRVSELEAALADAQDRHEAFAAQKAGEIARLNETMNAEIASRDEAIRNKSGEIRALEAGMKAERGKWDALLQQKNAEINSVGDQLREAAAKVSSLLKEKQGLETRSLELEARSADLARRLERLERDNRSLSQALVEMKKKTQPAD